MRKLLIVLLFLSFPAQALDIEIGTGTTHFKKDQNGLWYQEGFPYSEDLRDAPVSIGMSHQFEKYRARVEYLHLGRVHMSALAVGNDFLYAPGQPGNCISPCSPMYRYLGSGRVRGFVFSASRDVPLFGIPTYVEGGMYVYSPTWREVVVSAETGTIHVKLNHEPKNEFSPMLGLGIRYNGIDIGVRWFQLESSGDENPALYSRAYTLMLKSYF